MGEYKKPSHQSSTMTHTPHPLYNSVTNCPPGNTTTSAWFLKDLQEQLALRVYHDFKGPGNWEVYSDVEPALKILQTGAVLGAVSNFDERLG